MDRDQEQSQDLEHAVTHLLEEARMLLPGIQALFGFQLIAVFNTVFHERLQPGERQLHLAAMGLVALCVALVLAPAAYHRQAEPRSLSERFLRYSSRLLTVSMAVLMVALCMDFYLIARLVGDGGACSAWLAGCMLAVFAGLWFALPWHVARSRRRRPPQP
jgi:hypothetical protein